jgi:tetratricopeptide (TPR) repeat protein
MRLIFLIFLLAPFAQIAADGDIDSDSVIEEAAAAYDAENYEQAILLLEKAVETEPKCAECAHQLGRAYGRLAENTNWVSAIGLAKKSRVAFESAVELDPFHAQALEDLIRFYRDAPRFLGGDEEKADGLERRLLELRAAHTS